MIDIPADITCTELWNRVRLAESILAHRPHSRETASLALTALDGWTLADIEPGAK